MSQASALVVGGTGVISTAIVDHLLTRGMEVSIFNRGQRANTVAEGVRLIQGDRDDVPEFLRVFERQRFDVVFDMICYSPRFRNSTARIRPPRPERLYRNSARPSRSKPARGKRSPTCGGVARGSTALPNPPISSWWTVLSPRAFASKRRDRSTRVSTDPK